MENGVLLSPVIEVDSEADPEHEQNCRDIWIKVLSCDVISISELGSGIYSSLPRPTCGYLCSFLVVAEAERSYERILCLIFVS